MGTNNLIYDSQRRRHPAIDELREAFRYKYLILQLVRRDVLTRYKRSVLGVGWTLLNPLGMMLVLTIAFSQVFKFDVFEKILDGNAKNIKLVDDESEFVRKPSEVHMVEAGPTNIKIRSSADLALATALLNANVV